MNFKAVSILLVAGSFLSLHSANALGIFACTGELKSLDQNQNERVLIQFNVSSISSQNNRVTHATKVTTTTSLVADGEFSYESDAAGNPFSRAHLIVSSDQQQEKELSLDANVTVLNYSTVQVRETEQEYSTYKIGKISLDGTLNGRSVRGDLTCF